MNVDRVLAEPDRAKRLRPRDWQRLDRARRAESAPVPIVCAGCGRELASAIRGASAWCAPCRRWSGPAAGHGIAG